MEENSRARFNDYLSLQTFWGQKWSGTPAADTADSEGARGLATNLYGHPGGMEGISKMVANLGNKHVQQVKPLSSLTNLLFEIRRRIFLPLARK